MEITDVLDKLKQTKIIKDITPFEKEWVPDVFLHRESEIQEITYHLSSIVKYNTINSNLLITGQSGTGKTHVVKRVLEAIKSYTNKENNVFDFVYIKASENDSKHAIIRKFLLQKGVKIHPRSSFSVHMEEFENRLKEIDESNIIIVLDDIQFLFLKNKSDADQLLFSLSKLEIPEKRIGIILISNLSSKEFLDALSPPTKQNLKLREIYFSKYNAKQLFDILNNRIKMAVYENSVPSGVVSKISAMVAREWGSARFAIDLLFETIKLTELNGKNVVEENYVNEAYKILEISNLKEKIKKLPLHPYALLESIYNLYKENTIITTGAVYKKYNESLIKSNITPLTARRASDIIKELDADGLIEAHVVCKGKHGVSKDIKWIIPENIFEEVRREVKT